MVKNCCGVGGKSFFAVDDVFMASSSPIRFLPGIKHDKFTCAECNVGVIRGTRWQCAQCQRLNLCTKCYMKAAHNTYHKFLRHDTSTSEP